MSLNWQVNQIENNEIVTTRPKASPDEKDRWHPVTEALVWYSLICGFNQITEKNFDDVWGRIRCFEMIAPMMSDGERLAEEDVRRHIGLTTNASPKTPAQFAKHFVDCAKREYASPAVPAHERVAKAVKK